MNRKIAVTGGTGYIAGFIIAEFLNNGYEVCASVRNTAKASQLREALKSNVSEEVLKNFDTFEADLTAEKGWEEGFKGAIGIIHVASPLGNGTESAEALRLVAKGGTLNILKAAHKVGIKRIVMTSSLAACTPQLSVGAALIDETLWSDENNKELDAYRLSKIASERAAWDFSKQYDLALTTILPGAVFGPVMSEGNISSNAILLRLLKGQIPRALNVPFEISDVRDLATLHRLAFESDEAIGERFIAASQIITMPEVAKLYQSAYPNEKAPKKVFPNWMVKCLALVSPQLRSMVPMLGRKYVHSTKKAETVLDWTQRKPEETLLDSARAMKKVKLF